MLKYVAGRLEVVKKNSGYAKEIRKKKINSKSKTVNQRINM